MTKLDLLLAAVTARAAQLTAAAQAASVVNEKISVSCSTEQETVKDMRKGRKPLRESIEIAGDPAGYEARRTAAAAAKAGSPEKRAFAEARRKADADAAAAYAEALRPTPEAAEPEPTPVAAEPEPTPEATKKKKK